MTTWVHTIGSGYGYNPGRVLEVADEVAAVLIAEGVAELETVYMARIDAALKAMKDGGAG